MSKTNLAIHELKDFKKQVSEKLNTREIISFNLDKVDISEKEIDGKIITVMTHDGVVIEKEAMKKIVGFLRVKSNFFGLSQKMNPSDWRIVKEKLRNVGASQQIWARKNSETSTPVIDEIHLAFPKNDRSIPVDTIMDEVIESLVSTKKEYEVASTLFMSGKDKLVVDLLEDNEVDVFGTGLDMWRIGRRIVWDEMSFNIAPFFERKVCSNGNVSKQHGFSSNISAKKYNLEKVKRVLLSSVTLEDDKPAILLSDAATHLKAFNVSVREMSQVKKFFDPITHKDESKALEKYFDMSKIDSAYGCIVEEKPTLWQSTADTGINAYDFFNNVTYVASHPAEFPMEDKRKLELQIKASNLLFKKKLDLELVAPKVF